LTIYFLFDGTLNRAGSTNRKW